MQFTDDEICAAVLGYLAEHPQAADTLEGIAEWWILRRQIRVEVEQVARALGRLTHAGILEQLNDGGRCRYCLRKPLINETAH